MTRDAREEKQIKRKWNVAVSELKMSIARNELERRLERIENEHRTKRAK